MELIVAVDYGAFLNWAVATFVLLLIDFEEETFILIGVDKARCV